MHLSYTRPEQWSGRLQEIQIRATQSVLWDRRPIDKRAVVKVQSVLPQIELPSEILCKLSALRRGGQQFLQADKLSEKHYLSLKVKSIDSASSSRSIYQIPLSLSGSSSHEGILRQIKRKVSKLGSLEPIDLCRASVSYRASSLQSELIFPNASLQFTPISSLKIVSTPLSLQLTSGMPANFQHGLLTLDKAGRVLPLLLNDPSALQFPIIGIWASHIPDASHFTGKYTDIVHPLVWAACVHFLETRALREKISPDPKLNTFMCVHFNSRPKFYEVSCADPHWTVATVSVSNRRNTRSCSPEAVISQQRVMLAKLQAQLQELQTHVHSSPSVRSASFDFESEVKHKRNYCSGGQGRPKRISLQDPHKGHRPPRFPQVSSSQETATGMSNNESTVSIPRIEYDSPSCSYDEDLIPAAEPF